jgi:hypothetical protein
MCSIAPDSVLQYQEMVQTALRCTAIVVVEEATLALCMPMDGRDGGDDDWDVECLFLFLFPIVCRA